MKRDLSKKRKSVIILVVVLGLIGIGALVSTQFGVKVVKEAIVAKPIYEVSPLVTDLHNWPEWFDDAPKYQFRVINRNPTGISVEVRRDNSQSIYSIVAYPDSIPSKTHIQWTSFVSGFDWLKQKLSIGDDNPGNRLEELKKYFDNTKEFYGFDIKMEKVEDSLVLTKVASVKQSRVDSALRQLFVELRAYAGKEHLPCNIDSCRMATFYDVKNDSIRVAAGIPVAKRVTVPENGIKLLEMPARGKMLVGKYRGPYSGIRKLYSAMRKYVFDKKLVVVGAPYEKFLSKGSSPQDSLGMSVELHFPVL